MSFVKTLATLAVGFAAAKGMDKFNQMGGMEGLQKKMAEMSGGAGGAQGGAFGMFGQMAESMMPGGAAGLQGLMSALTGGAAAGAAGATAAAAGGAGAIADLFGALSKDTPVEASAEEQAKLMIRAMIQAAKCDGEIDADEQARIMEHLVDASPEEIAFVKDQLAAPLDIGGLASAADASVKAQVYSSALMAIRVDTDAEKVYLQQLAAALGLDAAQVAQMHAAMGVPTPD